MASSFTIGIECKHCLTHNPSLTIARQPGPSGSGVPEAQVFSSVALKIGGVYLCAKCGYPAGTSDEVDLPERVAQLLQTLIENCLFRVNQIVDYDHRGISTVWLSNRIDSTVHGQLTWSKSKVLPALPPGPSRLTGQPPQIAQHTVHLLGLKGMVRTELAGNCKAGNAALTWVSSADSQSLATVEQDAAPESKPAQDEATVSFTDLEIRVRWCGR